MSYPIKADRKSGHRTRLLCGLSGCITSLLLPSAAYAQDTEAAPSDSDIVVTGTLIRGVKAPAGSAVLDVNADTIKATSATSAGAILNQTVPQLPTFNTVATGSAGFGVPVTKIGLRGIGNTQGSASGQTATLVLFNGHRVVPVGILSTDPDPDLLPADILESVQVMPDGGSATYGSDAIGGVVNFVTKRKFDGVQLRYNYRFAPDYSENTASIVAGKSWSTGSAYISAVFNNNDEILGVDRDYIRQDFTSRGGADFRSTACGHGQFTVNGQVYTAPAFAPVAAAPRCDQTDYTSLVPRQRRYSVFGYVEQEITPDLKFSMDAIYSRRNTKVFTDIASLPASFTITNANPFFRPVAGETSQDVSFNYSRGLGNSRVSPQVFEQFQFDPSLTWTVNDNWQVKGDFLYGKSYSTIHDRTGLNSAAVNALNVNPYDTSAMDPAVLADLADHELYTRGVNGITSGQLVANGSLFELPGGALKIAIGGEIRRQTLRNSTVTGPIGDFTGLQHFNAGRTIKAAFAEIYAPIVSEQNSSPLMRGLTLNLSVRYDHYSDFGGTTNPRFGIDYRPFEDLVLRGNYQTSFVAPSLADSGNRIDTRLQVLTLIPDNYLLLIAGAGQNLKPQEGETFSIGGDWTPSSVPGLKVGVTYWNTRIDNLVSLSLGAYGFPGALFTPFGICGSGLPAFGLPGAPAGACTEPQLTALQPIYNRIDNQGAPINSIADLFAPGRNIVGVIDARRANFGSEKIDGLDFNISYGTDTSFGSVFAQVAGTYFLNKKISAVAGGRYVDYLSGDEVNGGTPRYNIVGTIGGTSGPFDGRITVRHNAGFDIPAGTVPGQSHVASYTVADIYAGVDLGETVGLKETTLSLSILNLFNQDPPYFGGQALSGNLGGYANGGTLGRTIGLGIQTKF